MNHAHFVGKGISTFSQLPRLDLEHPTDPKNYVDRQSAKGCPFNWQDDSTGQLRKAFIAFCGRYQTPRQLQMVIAYLQHHIHAPCWLEQRHLVVWRTRSKILNLRKLSLTLKTADEVRQYLRQAAEIGLDPL